MQQRELTPEAEKAIDRIQKLLALARNNDNEAEASLAMEAAQRMLEAHNLDMALVERKSGGSSVQKREDQKTGGGLYKWQRTVWEHTALLNFCRYQSIRGLARGSKYENRIIGSQVNVLATNVMGDYLQQTIERLAAQWVRENYPHGTSRFIRDAIAYREGMADRIAERLRQKRWDREQEQQEARDAMPRGDGTALILMDVIEAEDDANADIVDGLEPGTHARWRAESKARRMAADLEAKALLQEREEKEAENPALKEEREKREQAAKIKAEAENAAWWKKNGHKYRARDSKPIERRSVTYYDGREAGDSVGLDAQITDRKNTQKRVG